VLVAAQDIGVGTEITADMLKIESVSDELVVSGAYTETEPVVGQASRVAIARGEQITPGKLGVPVPENGLAGVVPAGKRAVALEVSEVTAVGGLLLPGDHIDIIAAFLVQGEPFDVLQTRTVLQDVEVLSVAQEAQKASAASSDPGTETTYTSGEVPDDADEQPNAGTLTLALDPQQVQVLVELQSNPDVERVFTALRPYGDQAVQDQVPSEVNVSD
jgi:pilus assembly protein CpaB